MQTRAHAWRRASPTAAYVGALLLTVLGFLLGLLVEPPLHPGAFFSLLVAVTLSAWAGGLGPGLLAALLSVAALTLVFTPERERASLAVVSSAAVVRLATYALVATLASKLREAQRAAKRRDEEHARELAAVRGEAAQEREAAEPLARRQQAALALLDTLLATSPVGFAFWDRELRFVRVNRELARMNGVPEEEHIGRTVGEVMPQLASAVEPIFRRVLESGEPVTDVEISTETLVAPRQPHVWEASYYPVCTLAGEVVGVGAAIVDITERRQLEAQLRHAQKMEAVGRLAGGVAHDFNNILTAIKSYSQFLLEALGAEDERAEDVREIARSADRAAALTRQLLAFSRRQVLQPCVLDLNEVVTEMERLLTRLIGEDVELVTRLEPELGQVESDRGQLEQVLMNLAVNSRDAMPFGGVLMVETANVDLSSDGRERLIGVSAGRYVKLAVRDTGFGIDAETMAHIFEPFFTTKPLGHGTGLGLSTVYGIVKQSGGDIRVESVPGKGTSFEIYLPRIPVEEGAAAARTAAALATKRGWETILLVEDDDTLRPLMRRVLQRQGYAILDAHHGLEALQIGRIHEGTIHLVVTDVVMPEMGGRDLAERLLGIRPDVKVLYLSGYADDVVIRRGILDPHMAYLQKPFTPDDLLRKVREVLEAPG